MESRRGLAKNKLKNPDGGKLFQKKYLHNRYKSMTTTHIGRTKHPTRNKFHLNTFHKRNVTSEKILEDTTMLAR